MAFWSDAGLEPKRKHKFLVFIGDLPAILAKSVNKPNADISVGEHKFLGNTYKFPGGIKWNDVVATFVDTEAQSIIQNVYDILYNAGNQTPEEKGLALAGGGSLRLFDKTTAVSALGNNILIQQVDEYGNPVEEWRLHNAWISKVDLGELSYENDNQLSEYKLTLVYDWATLTTYATSAATAEGVSSELSSQSIGSDGGLGVSTRRRS